jgi:hypothetical protein
MSSAFVQAASAATSPARRSELTRISLGAGFTAAGIRTRRRASGDPTRTRRARRPAGTLLALACTLGLLSPARDAAAAWRQTRFLVGGWGTADALRDPERLVRLDAAGIDFVHVMDHDLGHGAHMLAKLDSLHAAGRVRSLELVLHDPIPPRREEGFTRNPASARNWPAMERRIRTPGNGRAVLGFFVWDEPCTRAEMAQIGETVRRAVRAGLADRAVPFVNLLAMPEPGAGSCYEADFAAGRSRGAAYAAYLDAYLAQYDALPEPAPFLSLDSYPFLMDGKEGAAYFEALGIARDRAAAYGRPGFRVPLWVTLQLATFRPSHGKWQTSPTPAQLAWQVWGAVAYGAKSISYWTLSPSEDTVNGLGFGRGLLGSDGRPSTAYAEVRRIDAALHALGPVLMGLDPIAVFHVARGRQKGIERDLLDDRAASTASSPGSRARGVKTA